MSVFTQKGEGRERDSVCIISREWKELCIKNVCESAGGIAHKRLSFNLHYFLFFVKSPLNIFKKRYQKKFGIKILYEMIMAISNWSELGKVSHNCSAT